MARNDVKMEPVSVKGSKADSSCPSKSTGDLAFQ